MEKLIWDTKKVLAIEISKDYNGTLTFEMIKELISLVTNWNTTPYTLAPTNIQTAISTLKKLGVLKVMTEGSVDVQHLNS